MKLLRDLISALTLVLKALAPLIAEKALEARRARQKAEYENTIEKAAEALASGSPDALAVFWAGFDDELLSEGIGGDRGQQSDPEAARRKLQSEPGMDGEPREDGSGT